MFTEMQKYIYNDVKMGVVIEAFEKIRGILPGLFQFEKNDYFTQAELTVQEDELCIYNDHEPSEIVDANSKYYINVVVPFKSVKHIVVGKIKNHELKKFGRIAIVFKEKKKEPLYFYYFVKDKKTFKKMLKLLKHNRLKIRKKTVMFDLEKGKQIK